MSIHTYKTISKLCYHVDIETRKELSENDIANERDYMSTLSTRIRDAWKPHGKAYAYSRTLHGDLEQALGCDTLLVLHNQYGAKICLIEAKWPRVISKPNYKWDKLQKQKGISHFSSQIDRQKLLIPGVTVAEMFLVESTPGTVSSILDDYGSTLVLQEAASSFDASQRIKTKPWSNKDLWELMVFARDKKLNFENLVYGLASCSIGEPLPIINGEVTILSSGVPGSIRIPTSLERIEQLGPDLCQRLGISNFVMLELDRLSFYRN